MELKNAFLIVVIGFCFLIGYGYAEAEEICLNESRYPNSAERECLIISQIPKSDTGLILLNADNEFDQQNYSQAIKLYSVAADLDNWEGQFAMGMFNLNGSYGVEQNKEKAFLYLLSAAVNGYGKAMHNVAELKLTGQGTERDLPTALHWYKKAAEHNLIDSQFMVGRMYEMGWGINQNYKESFSWYMKAAINGDSESMYRLSYLINQDKNLGYDPTDSMMLLYLSKQAGSKEGIMAINYMLDENIISNDYVLKLDSWFQECNDVVKCLNEVQVDAMVRY
jgi:TPR repeat protein